MCVSTYPLQTVVQLPGFEQVLLLGPQVAADLLADGSELGAFGLNRVLGVVGALDQCVSITSQSQGSVQHLLWAPGWHTVMYLLSPD